jgi:methylated-DNA-[protein]-cysteine S-methyltransferase
VSNAISHQTPLGDLWSNWTTKGLFRLSWEKHKPAAQANSAQVVELDQLLQEYFETGDANFHRIEIDPTGWTEFSQRIYNACRQVESGETVSYKQLAALVGRPRASRAVGTAMAKNRITIVIPCHRVIASGGKIGGYGGPGGLDLKRKLLELERNK